MEYTTIYDACAKGSYPIPWGLFAVLFFLILLVFFIIWGWKRTDIKTKIGQVLVSAVLVVALIGVSSQALDSFALYKAYKSGDFKTVEGPISEYKTYSDLPAGERQPNYDDFCVNNVSFYITESPLFGFGYTQRQYDGGLLDEDVQVRIEYVEYKQTNVIFKLEVLPKN